MTDVHPTWNSTFAITTDGNLWAWGGNQHGQLGIGTAGWDEGSPTPVHILDSVISVYPGWDFTLALQANGTLWAWGNNEHGQLGTGTRHNSYHPVRIKNSVKSVSVSDSYILGRVRTAPHVLVVQTDGTLFAWGDNTRGQLGDGTLENRTSATKIVFDQSNVLTSNEPNNNVSTYAPAATEPPLVPALAVTEAQALPPAPPAATEPPAPVVVETPMTSENGVRVRMPYGLPSQSFDWIREFASSFFTEDVWGSVISADSRERYYLDNFVVLLNDRSLWAWGDNSNGQLGDGTIQNRAIPVFIIDDVFSAGLSSFGSGSLGRPLLVLRNDGTLWTWGENASGRIGDGTTTTRLSPVMVMENVISAAPLVGGRANAALLEDGTLWTWGENTNGQLGDSTTENRHSPVMILDNVVSFTWSTSSGSRGSGGRALKADGSLWAWGLHPAADGSFRYPIFDSPTPQMIVRHHTAPHNEPFTDDNGTEWREYRPVRLLNAQN